MSLSTMSNRSSTVRTSSISMRLARPTVARRFSAAVAGVPPQPATNRPVTRQPVATVAAAAAVVPQPAAAAAVVQSPPYKSAAAQNPTRRSLETEEKLLDCPACFNEATPPFMQCSNGHLVSCNTCLPNIHSCPTCRAAEPFVRNLIVEKTMFNCAYHSNGCGEKILGVNKMAHQRICLYRHANCIVPGCEWMGGRRDFIQHLTEDHSVTQTVSATDVKLDRVQEHNPHVIGFHPSQLCLISAWGNEFLITVRPFVLSATRNRFLWFTAINLTTWQSYGAKTGETFKAKLCWTDSTGDFLMSWVARVSENSLIAVPSEATFTVTQTEELQLRDPMLKVTIMPGQQ